MKLTVLSVIFTSFCLILLATGLNSQSNLRIFVENSHTAASNEFSTIIWSHEGSGLQNFIDWIVVRRLSRVSIIRFDSRCSIVENVDLTPESESQNSIRIHFVPFSIKTEDQATFRRNFFVEIASKRKSVRQIEFRRRSKVATILYHRIDNFPVVTRVFTSKFFKNFTKIFHEDLIAEKLDETRKILGNFLSNLNISVDRNLIEEDSIYFTHDALWWDRSDFVENSSNLETYFPGMSKTSTEKYLSRNRQCARNGIFFQNQHETDVSRSLPKECRRKPFDCLFSDILHFDEREQIYESAGTSRPLKCGFAVSSVFDRVRKLYRANQTCRIVFATTISKCYDPLPEIIGKIESGFCFVALLDSQTFRTLSTRKHKINWHFIDLGSNLGIFSHDAKTSETLRTSGLRLFPAADWVIWVDGKGEILNVTQLMGELKTPFVGPPHSDPNRTPEKEFIVTIPYLRFRDRFDPEKSVVVQEEIKFQYDTYRREQFFNRSKEFQIEMYDLAVVAYRNHQPCLRQYLCAWHNEVNYFSFRNQLSVFYPAVRMKILGYLSFFSHRLIRTKLHRRIC